MDQQKIARINELYRKSKAEGLTEAEKKEQKILKDRIYGLGEEKFKKSAQVISTLKKRTEV